MNNNEIENILSDKQNFMGCFAKLQSQPKSFPKTLIVNTAKSRYRGEH